MGAFTGPSSIKEAIEEKKTVVRSMRQNGCIDNAFLRKHTSVYVCARTDVEYALLLGCRNTVLVDSCYTDMNVIVQVLEACERIVDKTITPELSGRIVFDFDFGDGPEPASVLCKPAKLKEVEIDGFMADVRALMAILNETETCERKEFSSLIDGLVGFVFTHNSVYVDVCDEGIASKVRSKGYILTNRLRAFPENFRDIPVRGAEGICTLLQRR